MNLLAHMYEYQYTFNALTLITSILLSAEFIFIVRIRKPPYPWSSYSVAFVLFAIACNRAYQITHSLQPSTVFQLSSQYALNAVLLFSAVMIPLVRRGTYKRPRFQQLKEINQRLKYSQELFKRYLEEAPVAAYVKDKDSRIVNANNGVVHLFGNDKPVIGQTELWGDPDESKARDREIFAGGGQKEVTQTLRVKDETRTILDIRFPLSGPDQERMLGGIAIDLTSQLKRKNRIEVFASIVELSPDAIYSLDKAGCVLTWNPAAEKMFGYSREEMIGNSILQILPKHAHHELDSMMTFFQNEQNSLQQFESERISRDGFPLTVIVSATRVPAPDKLDMTIAVLLRDITRKKLVEEKIGLLHQELQLRVRELSLTNQNLQEARDKALESSSMKSAFVANISHELRTPLSGILGMSELLAQKTLDEDANDMVEMLNESAQTLLQVVDDILDLAKLEAGKGTVEHEVFSVRNLMQDCGELFAPSAVRQGLTLIASVEENVPDAVRSDPSIIKQLLFNLITNAIKFTKSGGITVNVSIAECAESQLQLSFAVTDTGAGIDKDHLPLLLTPFVRVAQSTDGTAGTGLGLVLCKRLVELLHGQISCVSQINEGSTFTFVIPVTRADDPFTETEKRSISRVIPLHELARCRILSVDDSPVVSRLTFRQLGIIGVQAETASTGEQAIEKARAGNFDLILMDVHLPDMTGYQAAQRIRELEIADGRPRTIIIALTGVTHEHKEQAALAGMDDFLSKPVSIDLLRTHLMRSLSNRRNAKRSD